MSKTRGILYSSEMIRAKLEGRKTQTRRIVKLPKCDWPKEWMSNGVIENDVMTFGNDTWGKECDIKCPYGKVGDILYAKEAIRGRESVVDATPQIEYLTDGHIVEPDYSTFLGELLSWERSIRLKERSFYSKHNALFMPKFAARIIDEITGIRVERLQGISEADAIAEGIEWWIEERMKSRPRHYRLYWVDHGDESMYSSDPVDSYRSLWIKINGKASWDANPWVWIIETKNLSITGWNNLNRKQNGTQRLPRSI